MTHPGGKRAEWTTDRRVTKNIYLSTSSIVRVVYPGLADIPSGDNDVDFTGDPPWPTQASVTRTCPSG